MATAGWYPDPSGLPGAFRYWDGTVWSETVADTPYGPAPAGMTPPAPSSPPPPPPGYESHAAVGPLRPPAGSGPGPGSGSGSAVPPPPPPSPGNGSGRTFGYLLVAVVLTLALGIGTFFVVGGLLDDEDPTAQRTAAAVPSTQQPDPESSAEPSDGPPTDAVPTDPATEVEPTAQQCTGGLPERGATGGEGRFMTGGGFQVPTPDGFEPVLDQPLAFTFADGVYTTSKVIEQSATSGWVAVYALGSLSRGNGFASPRQAAETVVACMSRSSVFYSNFTGSTTIASEETVVDGYPAWDLTKEIRIDDPELTVEGDVVRVVVVDTGDPASYALFVSVVPIGDQALIAEQDDAVGQLKVR